MPKSQSQSMVGDNSCPLIIGHKWPGSRYHGTIIDTSHQRPGMRNTDILACNSCHTSTPHQALSVTCRSGNAMSHWTRSYLQTACRAEGSTPRTLPTAMGTTTTVQRETMILIPARTPSAQSAEDGNRHHRNPGRRLRRVFMKCWTRTIMSPNRSTPEATGAAHYWRACLCRNFAAPAGREYRHPKRAASCWQADQKLSTLVSAAISR